MKYLFLVIFLCLAGCATCKIPLSEFSSMGGNEALTNLTLKNQLYSLSHEFWAPGQYELREKKEYAGKWSCKGDLAYFSLENHTISARFRDIGNNPLGLPESTKALVFDSSKLAILSNEILYTASTIE